MDLMRNSLAEGPDEQPGPPHEFLLQYTAKMLLASAVAPSGTLEGVRYWSLRRKERVALTETGTIIGLRSKTLDHSLRVGELWIAENDDRVETEINHLLDLCV